MNKKKMMFVFAIVTIIGASMYYLSTRSTKLYDEYEVFQEEMQQEEPHYPLQEAEIAVETFQTAKGWGYCISINGTGYISQARRPAVGGDKGFSTQEDAQKVGSLVADKIRKGLLPPGISREELDSLGVIE